MSRYIEYLRKRRRDFEANVERYLGDLRRLAKEYGGSIYVYGSRIWGEALPSSDLDVLIEIPDDVDRLEVLHRARSIVRNTMIEIHVLNRSDAEEFKRIIKHYIEL